MHTADLGHEGLVFHHDMHFYRTTGRLLGEGGIGSVFGLERYAEGGGEPEPVVAKVFQSQYLYRLRTDQVTRHDHHTNLRAVDILGHISHPHVLPVYLSTPIADNFLLVSPLKGKTLHEAVTSGELTPRQRVKRLIEALYGLSALHEARLIHRDVTLRNIILDQEMKGAFLFDFDLVLSLDEVVGISYGKRYRGRIFGSPGYSVPPEIIDPALMECAITSRSDIYAIGGAVFALFTGQTPHGPTGDMWHLLARIAEGVVYQGVSRVVYPDEVPKILRPVIERCLERDPGNRYGSTRLLIRDLESCLDKLDDGSTGEAFFLVETLTDGSKPLREERVAKVHEELDDPSISSTLIEFIDTALSRYGYQVQSGLGRVGGHPVFAAEPKPELVVRGQFPDANTYPKVVTAINLVAMPDPQGMLDLWFGRYMPILMSVRQGQFTTLYKVVYDEVTGQLLLFSELVADPRFGTQLQEHELSLHEALGLAFLVVRQVVQLHEHGLAHNNVRPESLLIKGISDSHEVRPCMAGLVQPSLELTAIREDVRGLARMVLEWLEPSSLLASDMRVRSQIENLRARLAEISVDESEPTGVDELVALLADALSAVDYNFGVLRENGGDLLDYALLQVSRRLYHRLW